ncbi:hypothetical protein ACIP79_00640 [Streptomyces sp. NPDC088747]|uniref:hypothetical protein n=1 Tax=Streptomyces sp. NPDC088747 TaxID=3365886 RepID=UPI00382CB127
MPALGHFKITVQPFGSDPASWGWTLGYTDPDGSDKVIRSGAPYVSATAAKRAAEEQADAIASALATAETYTYTPSVVGRGGTS